MMKQVPVKPETAVQQRWGNSPFRMQDMVCLRIDRSNEIPVLVGFDPVLRSEKQLPPLGVFFFPLSFRMARSCTRSLDLLAARSTHGPLPSVIFSFRSLFQRGKSISRMSRAWRGVAQLGFLARMVQARLRNDEIRSRSSWRVSSAQHFFIAPRPRGAMPSKEYRTRVSGVEKIPSSMCEHRFVPSIAQPIVEVLWSCSPPPDLVTL